MGKVRGACHPLRLAHNLCILTAFFPHTHLEGELAQPLEAWLADWKRCQGLRHGWKLGAVGFAGPATEISAKGGFGASEHGSGTRASRRSASIEYSEPTVAHL
jgi:hypothetical protein